MARILVVDDDPVVGALLLETLVAAGHAGILANRVAEGFELIQRQSLDLALVDVEISGRQHAGFELLKRIKEHNPSIAVIIITGAGSKQRAVAALRGGAQDFIEKPFSPEDVVKRVTTALIQQKIEWAY